MALPEGITTATVIVGVPVTHTGAAVKTYVSIEPSAYLVHAATGTPLVDFLEELSIAEGVAGQFTLPHTDQPGFTDENGNAYTNWYYTARVTYSTPSKAKNKAPKIKVFQLTTGQTEVDLDKLPGGAPALPYSAPTAKVDAFNGRTGTVTLQESDLPERLTDTALSATIQNAFTGYETRTAPAGFAFRTLPLPVVKHLGYGKFAFDAASYIAPYRPAAGVTYYVSPAGVSGNNGLTSGAPTTLATAAGKADVGTIMLAPGEYFRNTGLPLLAKSLNIIGTGAKPSDTLLTGFENPSTLVWTLNAGNIYQTTRATTIAVVDKRTAYVDANGDWSMYEQKTDLASITAAGQWAISGTTVYVWPHGNVNLATDASFMRLSLNTGTGPLNWNGANTIYAENLITEGGGGPTVGAIGAYSSGGVGGVPRMLLVDVLAKYCIANGITTTGAEFAIIVRAGAAVTGADGLNHHSGTFGGTTYYPDVLEVDDASYNNGRFTTVETQNAVTTHDGIKAVRIGGTIGPSFGPVMGEDGAGTKSWNLGVKLKRSTAVVRNYAVAATSGAEIWLDECTDEGGSLFTVYADNASKVHTRNMVNGSSTKLRSKIVDTSTLDTY